MQVPLLDLRAQMTAIRADVERQIAEVLDSCQFVNGPKVVEFESAVAEYLGVEEAIGVSSGTDALLIALMALELPPGARVITTPYSFFATAGTIARLGARPVFVDIDPETFNMDPAGLRTWFETHEAEAETVGAIMPVHLYGQSADLDPILAVAAERGVPVVEDAAQAIGTRYEGATGIANAGTLGQIGCFSFFPSKNLGAMGDGGLVVTRDRALAAKLRKLRNHGAEPKYYHDLIGGNFRLDAMQAAILLAKLPHLDTWHAARRAHAARYDQAFCGVNAVIPPKVTQSRNHHIYNQYVLTVPDRDRLRAHLKDAGVGSEIYYPVPFHEQACFQHLGYGLGDFPAAESAARSTLAIPVYPELTSEMQDHVVRTIQQFYE